MQDDKSLCAAVTICVTLVNIQSCSGWIAKWVASSGIECRKARVRFPAAQKCWAQLEFVNIYQFRFHPMLKYACVYCVRFVLLNFAALWLTLALACSCLPPMRYLVCYVWLYYNWFFVFNFNCICAVLRGNLLCSCGLSTTVRNKGITNTHRQHLINSSRWAKMHLSSTWRLALDRRQTDSRRWRCTRARQKSLAVQFSTVEELQT